MSNLVCSINDPKRICTKGPGVFCVGCGFEIHEAERRKALPLLPDTVQVPFTDEATGKLALVDYDVRRRFVGKPAPEEAE